MSGLATSGSRDCAIRSSALRIIVGFAVLLTTCSSDGLAEDDSSSQEAGPRADLDRTVAFVTESWPTDWSRSVIGLDELVLGVSATEPRDAIPPLDDPAYESLEDAAKWLEDREPGTIVQIGEDARFFPLSIMNRHEIVNDRIGGVPVAVTYCPLCNSAVAFDRRIDDQTLRFGVSGLLRNSDLIMWDDQTVSLWQQVTGEAIVGTHAGRRLMLLSTAIASFGDFRASFPDGLSLSPDTGFELAYGINPYEGYSGRFTPLMPVTGERDDRFLPMERVVGVSVGDANKAYPFSVLAAAGAVNDAVGGVPVVVLWGSPETADPLGAEMVADGRSIGTALALDPVVGDRTLTFAADGDSFVDAETGSTWTVLGRAIAGPLEGAQLDTVIHRNDFWFAWSAFFPDAEVYQP